MVPSQHVGGLPERLHRVRDPKDEVEEQPLGRTRTEVRVSWAEGTAGGKAPGHERVHSALRVLGAGSQNLPGSYMNEGMENP